eukprot:Protomagalhaensia_sp_Gyna_25__0@NODE_1000_length_2308_cov_57_132217_g797_i0_p3_GENE_NODE_1000_length_2308_cov_57_132217_g797_i0NODE_1000_length_2308_cov_57_132217_g797_i0_p3_ORF_typecomplete_len106_score19_51Sigma70_r4_2/PF08281_12/0_00084Sigma70_ECF/PF07638_11/0_0032DUF1127/PF06568_11/0_029_NODE_1000_length_2308_cov_57_132217_g797_i011911508
MAMRGVELGAAGATEDMEAALSATEGSRTLLGATAASNVVAVDLLQKIPKLREGALNRAVRRALSLRHLLTMPNEELADVLGCEEAAAFAACLRADLSSPATREK